MTKPTGVYVRIPLSPEAVAKLAEHVERLEEVARLTPDAVRIGRALFSTCAELLTSIEKDLNAAAASVGKRSKRKLPRARRRGR